MSNLSLTDHEIMYLRNLRRNDKITNENSAEVPLVCSIDDVRLCIKRELHKLLADHHGEMPGVVYDSIRVEMSNIIDNHLLT